MAALGWILSWLGGSNYLLNHRIFGGWNWVKFPQNLKRPFPESCRVVECGKAMCVLAASCKVPSWLWWAAGGSGGWELNSSRAKRAVS